MRFLEELFLYIMFFAFLVACALVPDFTQDEGCSTDTECQAQCLLEATNPDDCEIEL